MIAAPLAVGLGQPTPGMSVPVVGAISLEGDIDCP